MSKLSRRLFDFLNSLEGEFSIHRWRSTVKQNDRVGGAKKSRHLSGDAVDISADSIEELEVIARKAEAEGIGGIELDLTNAHLHLDDREIDWHVIKTAGGFSPLAPYLRTPKTV